MAVREPSEPWVWWRKASAERGRRGWSVAELGRRMDEDGHEAVDPIQLRRWLQGKHEPRHEIIRRVERAFGWPPGYIEDPQMGYPPPHDRAWLDLTIRNLDDNGRRVLAALNDPACAEYLAKALDQYRALAARMREYREAEEAAARERA